MITIKTNFKKLLKIFLPCVLSVAFFACDKSVSDRDEIGPLEPLQPGEVRIKAYPNEDNKISFIVVSQKIIIDWGDDTTEEYTPNGWPERFIHEYTDKNPRNITLRTEEMNVFGAFSLVKSNNGMLQTFGNVEEIIFGKCPGLEEVILRGNGLIRLEMEEVKGLNLLDCSYNKLSASKLNGLFNSLPASDEGILIFRENTGSATCDASIVLSKGWTVQTSIPDEEIKADEFPDTAVIADIVGPEIFDDEAFLRYMAHTFSDFENFLKPFYLLEAFYSQTILPEGDIAPYYSYLYNHQITADSSFVAGRWAQSYQTIRNFSTLINLVPQRNNAAFSDYIHTANVLRCYVYFLMVNYWGDVPYFEDFKILEDANLFGDFTDLYPSSTDKNLILNRLILHLLEAESRLPETETEYILSKSYVRLMLARIYTYQGKYAEALAAVNTIMESGKFSLSPVYSDIFEDVDNEEHLTRYRTVYHQEGASWENLIRKGNHAPFGRYAETLLLASEASLKTGNIQAAVDYLNQLRIRNNRTPAAIGYEPPHATVPMSPSAMESLILEIEDLILEEYKLDMGKEGLYFLTLKRFGKAEEVLEIASFRLLLPIPEGEIIRNPGIVQNEGY